MELVFLPQPVGCQTSVSSAAPRRRRGVAVTAFILGTAIGGTFAGGLIGSLGAITLTSETDQTVSLVGVGTLASLAVALQWRGRVGPLPERKRQVPREWVNWKFDWMMGIAFGVLLGMAWWTYLGVASIYVVGASAFLSRSPVVGALIGLLYGIGRGLPLALTPLIRRWRNHRQETQTAAPAPAWTATMLSSHASRVLRVASALVTAGVIAFSVIRLQA